MLAVWFNSMPGHQRQSLTLACSALCLARAVLVSGTGFGPSLLTLDGMMSDIVGLVGGARRLFDRDRYCEVCLNTTEGLATRRGMSNGLNSQGAGWRYLSPSNLKHRSHCRRMTCLRTRHDSGYDQVRRPLKPNKVNGVHSCGR